MAIKKSQTGIPVLISYVFISYSIFFILCIVECEQVTFSVAIKGTKCNSKKRGLPNTLYFIFSGGKGLSNTFYNGREGFPTPFLPLVYVFHILLNSYF